MSAHADKQDAWPNLAVRTETKVVTCSGRFR